MNLVSIIMPVCNQGDEARRTVASARKAIGELRHEIILVDDHCIDGSCHGMPQDVLVVRSERRNGVSSARRIGFKQAQGDVVIWSDPHCRYPADSLNHLAQRAREQDAIVQPKTRSKPNARPVFGGKLVLSDRGLRVGRSHGEAAAFPALINTIYAMKRTVYEQVGGWPKLPGIWSYSEQAMTLASWFRGIPICVDPRFTCLHASLRRNKRFPFSVSRADTVQNAHYVHAAFFPRTYPSYWRPMLENRFRKRDDYLAPLADRAFRKFQQRIQRHAVRTEEEFFRLVLGVDFPNDYPSAA